MKKIKEIKPSFYDKFHCIGGECQYTCCQKWAIQLYKEEFKKMRRSIQSEKLKDIFSNAFVADEGESLQKTDLYRVKLTQNGFCPFLDEGGLCGFQKECGYEALSRVCKIFPRRAVLFCHEKCELSLSLGCEEVVRLLLAEKDGFYLENFEGELDSVLVGNNFIEPIQKQLRPILNEYYSLKFFVMAVLQNRRYTMGQRMTLLGIALSKIHHMEAEKKVQDVSGFIRYFLNEIAQKDCPYHAFFEKNKSNPHIKLLNTLQKHYKIAHEFGIEKQLQKIEVSIESYFTIADNNIKTELKYDAIKYEESVKNFELWLEKNGFVLENIMVSAAWQLGIPFAYGKDIWQNYCIFAMIYSMYYFVLSICVTEDTTQKELIQYIVLLSRELLHGSKNLKILEEELEKNESDTLAHMIKLVL